jgi:hypothetical protein
MGEVVNLRDKKLSLVRTQENWTVERLDTGRILVTNSVANCSFEYDFGRLGPRLMKASCGENIDSAMQENLRKTALLKLTQFLASNTNKPRDT